VTASKDIMGISRLLLTWLERNSTSTFIHAFTSFLPKRRELSQATITYDTNRLLHFLRDFSRNSCVFNGSGELFRAAWRTSAHSIMQDSLRCPLNSKEQFSTLLYQYKIDVPFLNLLGQPAKSATWWSQNLPLFLIYTSLLANDQTVLAIVLRGQN